MALVISRNPDEKLVLNTPDGHRITIKVNYIAAKESVRVVIDAPRAVVITRGELERS